MVGHPLIGVCTTEHAAGIEWEWIRFIDHNSSSSTNSSNSNSKAATTMSKTAQKKAAAAVIAHTLEAEPTTDTK